MNLTIAYFTSRRLPMIEYFLDSLARETGNDYAGIRIVVVDFWFHERPVGWFDKWKYNSENFLVFHTAPKPTVWQGEFKLTREDWFAASNARNTAICYAPDGWIAFCDDLSVLLPGWLAQVRQAMDGDQKTIGLGSYKKQRDLVVDNGNIVSFTPFPPGVDNRLSHVTGDAPVPCGGNWMYGCSLIAPVEAFLEINGFPEALCDGMGFEDVICGLQLSAKGYKFEYRPAMMTYESDELHAQLPVMKRSDYGVSPQDKSHHVLHWAQHCDGWHPNYFGAEHLRGLRQRILAGEDFPVVQIPDREWFTGKLLSEL